MKEASTDIWHIELS